MSHSTTTIDTVEAPITVEFFPSADEMLTPKVRQVIRGALPIFERLSEEAGIGPSALEVEGYVSPDSGSKRLVLTQWVSADPDEAMAHWSNVARAYYAWIETLSPELERIAREQVGVAVAWTDR